MDSNDRGVLGQCHPAPIVDVTHPVRVVHRLIRAVRVHIAHHVRNVTVRTQQIGDVVAAETAVEEELERGWAQAAAWLGQTASNASWICVSGTA